MKQILQINSIKLPIITLTSQDFALTEDYQFNILATNQKLLNITDFVNKPAILHIKINNIYGIITTISGPTIGSNHEFYNYKFTMNSPLTALKHHTHNRIFTNLNIVDLIAKILHHYPIKYQVKITTKYRNRAIFIQHNETDYEFLLRNLKYFGMFFGFIEKILIITDDLTKFPTHTGKHIILDKTTTARLLAQTVTLSDYNYRTPEIKLKASAKTGNGYGEHSYYGQNFHTQEECELFTKIRLESINWQRRLARITTDLATLLPGMQIESYRIISTNWSIDKNGLFLNRLTLIPKQIAYRPSHRPTSKPGIHFAFTTDDSIDNQGRYKVRFPFTELPTKSPPLRLMQPFAGEDYGFHFPLSEKSKVIYTFIDGNLQKPVLLGTIPNHNYPSPVTNHNSSQNILRNDHNTELLFDEDKISLNLPNKTSQLVLDASKQQPFLALISKYGKLNASCQKNFSLQSKDTINIYCKSYAVVTKKFQANSQHNILLNSKQSLSIKTNNNLNIRSKQGQMGFHSHNNAIFHAATNTQIRAKNLFFSNSQNFNLQTKQKITLKAPNLEIGNNKCKITVTKNGVIHIKAQQINFQSLNNSLNAVKFISK